MEKVVLNRTLISLGSNLGDKSSYINQAIDAIQNSIGNIEFISSFYESAPWGYDSQNQFINACITCHTTLPPLQLLDQLKEIERYIGRVKTTTGYEDRCIDLDIIFYNDEKVNSEALTIPHPHFKTREFVMIPLREIIKKDDPFYHFIKS
jgi:2-amino-4-hydroxy-6-hydroxymethyldihydropteridine diphosphokinase